MKIRLDAGDSNPSEVKLHLDGLKSDNKINDYSKHYGESVFEIDVDDNIAKDIIGQLSSRYGAVSAMTFEERLHSKLNEGDETGVVDPDLGWEDKFGNSYDNLAAMYDELSNEHKLIVDFLAEVLNGGLEQYWQNGHGEDFANVGSYLYNIGGTSAELALKMEEIPDPGDMPDPSDDMSDDEYEEEQEEGGFLYMWDKFDLWFYSNDIATKVSAEILNQIGE